MTIPIVSEVGRQIEQAWSACDYEVSAFPSICCHHLAQAHLHEALSPKTIVDWALQGVLPRQSDPNATFGQPPITMFRSRRFFIDALFWVDGTTTIHDHEFSGAFQVLAGSSIETTFAFDCRRDVGGHLYLGALDVVRTQLLTQGDVRPIFAGRSFIHSLFHLPRPAVSLVVRTFADVKPGLQLNYLPPGIAYNAFHSDETLLRLVQFVDLMRTTDDPRLEDSVGALIARSDLHTAFSLVKACIKLSDRSLLGRLIERVRDPEAREPFLKWIAAADRIRFIQAQRTTVRDPDLRFFLAVLLNTHGRQEALALVTAHVPATPPGRQIAAWLAKLSIITVRLQLASGPWEPSLLGLPPFTPRLEEVLAAELGGQCDVRSEVESDFLTKLRSLPPLSPLFR